MGTKEDGALVYEMAYAAMIFTFFFHSLQIIQEMVHQQRKKRTSIYRTTATSPKMRISFLWKKGRTYSWESIAGI